jgi:hypothetical protein
MKQQPEIHITISPIGVVKIEGEGFSGDSCKEPLEHFTNGLRRKQQEPAVEDLPECTIETDTDDDSQMEMKL